MTPINYKLEFEPNLEKATFRGSELLTIHCPKPTKTITLHCAELKIRSCRVEHSGDTVRSSYALDAKSEELRVRLASPIKGVPILHVEFDGILNDRLLGFYRSSYKRGKKTTYMATTQFEAADARRAFPCVDEPAAKATFDITIISDNRYVAISNMPILSRKKIGSKTSYTFQTTPIMSTYLVYLGVGDFERVSGMAGKTKVSVLATRGNKPKLRFALDLGKKLLSEYEKYFGIKYPLPKLDLIAIPDFAAGAMENWGAITFRETILLYDPKTSSTRTKQFIAEVISHEIAHQWFGNLVTMEWWNDLWLNESFATFMATKFVDKFYPEWGLWDQFLDDAMTTAMSLDSLRSTHPIDVHVDSPSQIREIFDAISYDKGGCVLQMLEDYVGEPAFRSGLARYLSEFRYANAKGEDLWDAIGRAAGRPISAMIHTWLKQPGFPIVEARQSGRRIHLKQKRYLADGGKAPGLWKIPVSMGPGGSKTVLERRAGHVRAPGGIGYVVNAGRRGFYRVKYDKAALIDLKMMVDGSMIGHVDRWAIQNDLFSLCVSGEELVRDYLDFTDAYCGEKEYLPAVNVARGLSHLYHVSFGTRYAGQVRAYAVNYMRGQLARIGWDPAKSDNHTDGLLRPLLISSLGRMRDRHTTEEALKRYAKLLRSHSSINPDMTDTICSIAAWNGNHTTHAQLKRLYIKAGTMEEKLRYLGAMCGFADPKLLKATLDFSLGPHVKSQNMQLPIMRIAANPHGSEVLWPWLQKNWKRLDTKIGRGNPLFNRIVSSLSMLNDAPSGPEMKKFFKKNPVPGTERVQRQTAERIRIRARFSQRMASEFA